MDTLGMLVRVKRDKKGESAKQLARVLKCSEAFVRHIESSRCVPISPRIVSELKKHYRLRGPLFERAVAIRSRTGKAYFKQYRSKPRSKTSRQ